MHRHPSTRPPRSRSPRLRRRARGALALALLSPVLVGAVGAVGVGTATPASAEPAGDVVFDGGRCAPVLVVQRARSESRAVAATTGSLDATGAAVVGDYAAGRDGDDHVRRDYVVLDTSDLGDGWQRASLHVPAGPGCRSTGEPGTFRLFEVDASTSALAGSPDPAHFDDLGSGRSFGAVTVPVVGEDVVVPLGDAAVQAVKAGRTSLVIGGTWRERPAEPGEVVVTGVRVRPGPVGHGGWSRRPVTVSFHCSSTYPLDARGCPGPVRVGREGLTRVTRVATDVDGVTASDTVVVRIDRTAPRLRLRHDPRGRTFARVPALGCVSSDALSGLRRGCEGRFDTVRTRADGRRVVAFRVSAYDVAGNARHRHGRFLLR